MDYLVFFCIIVLAFHQKVHTQTIPGFVEHSCSSSQTISVPESCEKTKSQSNCEVLYNPIYDTCNGVEHSETSYDCPTSEDGYKDKCYKVPYFDQFGCSFTFEATYLSHCIETKKKQICGIASLPTTQECLVKVNYIKPYECFGTVTTKECVLEMKQTGLESCTGKGFYPVAFSRASTVSVHEVTTRNPQKKGYCTKVISSFVPDRCDVEFVSKMFYESTEMVENLCERELIIQEPYDCSEMETIFYGPDVPLQCSKLVTKTVQVKNPLCSSFRARMSRGFLKGSAPPKIECGVVELQYQQMENYRCSGPFVKSNPKLCFKESTKTVTVPCQSNGATQASIDMPISLAEECLRPVVEKSEVPCPDQNEVVITSAYEKEIKLRTHKFVLNTMPLACPKNDFVENCTFVNTPLKSECYANFYETIPQACQRIELQEYCEEKEIEESSLCIKSISFGYRTLCHEPQWEEKCGSGPTSPTGKCILKALRGAYIPCAARTPSSIKCEERNVQVESTCLKKEEIPYVTPCYSECFSNQTPVCSSEIAAWRT